MYQKLCPNCKIEFQTPYKSQQFCKRKCWCEWMKGKNNPNPSKDKIELKCKSCGNSIFISQWELNHRPNLKYCSRKCRGKDIEWQKNISKTLITNGSHKKERNSNWKGGKSYEPYSSEFDKKLKEQIRERDTYICQLCSTTEKEQLAKLGHKLYIHHIDYDKKNCDYKNLIALCQKCNSIVNFKRQDWINYFKEKLSIY